MLRKFPKSTHNDVPNLEAYTDPPEEDLDVTDAELFTYAPSEKMVTTDHHNHDDDDNTADPTVTIPTSTEAIEAEGKVADEIEVSLLRRKRGLVAEAEKIPLHVFRVQKGKRYRFRLINAEFLNCPMELSIDNHTMTMIASDGSEFVPVEVDSFVSYAGERFDFILNANQRVSNYWIRAKGLMDCDERFTSAHQTAILRYVDAVEEEPAELPSYNHTRTGIMLNALNKGQEDAGVISIASVKSLLKEDAQERRLLQKDVDFKFYIYYDFYGKNNTNFHKPNMYGFEQVGDNQKLYSPQLNHISMRLPHFPLMPARHMIDNDTFCNSYTMAREGRNCKTEFCQCPHVLEVPMNATVELVIIDEGK